MSDGLINFDLVRLSNTAHSQHGSFIDYGNSTHIILLLLYLTERRGIDYYDDSNNVERIKVGS